MFVGELVREVVETCPGGVWVVDGVTSGGVGGSVDALVNDVPHLVR